MEVITIQSVIDKIIADFKNDFSAESQVYQGL